MKLRRARSLPGVLLAMSVFLVACGATGTPTTTPIVPSRAAAVPAATAPVAPTATVAPPSAPATAAPARAASPPAGTPVAGGATPAPSLPVTVRDKDGRAVTVADASRVIPLNGDIAEIIFALGLGERVIATDTSATYPPAAAALPKIGYQRTLAAEGILALRPTLVIGGESAGPPEVLEQLRGAGVPVLIVATPATLDAPARKIRAVAAALGIPEAGERLATQTQREIDEATALAARAATKPVVMFLYLRGTGTQQIGGRGSTADALILAAGGIDAGTAAGISGYKPVTAEAVVAGRPEVFLLLSAGLQSIGGVEGLLQLPGVAQTPAGQAGRVLAYEDQYLLGLGPRTGQALRELALALHPELK